MNHPANHALRLPRSIKDGVAEAARRDGVSMNQFIPTAVAEKLAVLQSADFFEQRAARADAATFDRIMSRSGGEAPRNGDELP